MVKEKIMAVNHNKKMIMPVGHELWLLEGFTVESPVEEQLQQFKPRMPKSHAAYTAAINDFGVEDLMRETDANKLGYTKVKGFWATLEVYA